ncbi:MAG: 4-alpha-glucanotransferase [Phycisphaerae bacterium]|nr:4-alpha-glucanotransferase [Phycisphaerae bacterium]
MNKRASGILLHISSLPSKYGIGDFGPGAYRFVDFLKETKQSRWQVLPLNQIKFTGTHSPYDCLSAFAGNILFISPDLLYRDGLLDKADLKTVKLPAGKVDYAKVISCKQKLFAKAFEKFKEQKQKDDFESFCEKEKDWLDDYSLFMAIKEHLNNKPWSRWDKKLRDRDKKAMTCVEKELADRCEYHKFLQFIFFNQWQNLKQYCNNSGIQIIGDIPIYVTYESADVWANPSIFQLDRDKRPKGVSGVPPDYFSKTGQLWSNPLYDWERLKKNDYGWWMRRMDQNFRLFDIVRIDHFRGLVAYWQIPAGNKTAMNGKWVAGPKNDFFKILFKRFSAPPIIVEDLGDITSDVRRFVKKLCLPGMKVLCFAFDGKTKTNPHYPHNHIENAICYTGTHDNNTIRGWFEKELNSEHKKEISDYIGCKLTRSNIHTQFMRIALKSVCRTCIIPMQDVLGLGGKARMNHPAKLRGNWQWRLEWKQVTKKATAELVDMAKTYNRT